MPRPGCSPCATRRFGSPSPSAHLATAKKPGGRSGIGSGSMYSLSCTYLLPRRMTTGDPFFKTLSSRRPSFGLAVETVKYSMDRNSVHNGLCQSGIRAKNAETTPFFYSRPTGASGKRRFMPEQPRYRRSGCRQPVHRRDVEEVIFATNRRPTMRGLDAIVEDLIRRNSGGILATLVTVERAFYRRLGRGFSWSATVSASV